MSFVVSGPCPACGASAGKTRVGSLGESKGVWCTQCGHAVDHESQWTPTLKSVTGSIRQLADRVDLIHDGARVRMRATIGGLIEGVVKRSLVQGTWHVVSVNTGRSWTYHSLRDFETNWELVTASVIIGATYKYLLDSTTWGVPVAGPTGAYEMACPAAHNHYRYPDAAALLAAWEHVPADQVRYGATYRSRRSAHIKAYATNNVHPGGVTAAVVTANLAHVLVQYPYQSQADFLADWEPDL